MYLSIVKLWNFRKYSTGENNAPGLEVRFHKGVNVLVGENDSGKTAVVDAIRYVLKTHSGEFIQFDEKVALVEELEAHLHPQYQLRLIEYISSQEKNEQFILTTHSITLASKIKLENLIILKDNDALPMSSEYTHMSPSDYRFLERFLDATKANLFFAKGLILVEGDAENLLIPAISHLIGKNLYMHGVSVVNIGSTAYKRYVNIFKRKDGKSVGMPIAVVSDLDVRALEYYDDGSKDRQKPKYWLKETIKPELEKITTDVDYESMAAVYESKGAFEEEVKQHKKDSLTSITKTISKMKEVLTEESKTPLNEDILKLIRAEKRKRLEKNINSDNVRIFLPQSWTLEYEIAGSEIYRLLAFAIKAAREESKGNGITDSKLSELWKEVNVLYPKTHTLTEADMYNIFKPLNDGSVSKAITSQYLAEMLTGDLHFSGDYEIAVEDIKSIVETDEKLKYLVDAIHYVTH